MSSKEKLSEIVTRLLDDGLDSADRSALIELLEESEEAAGEYVALLRTELMLHWEMREGLPGQGGRVSVPITTPSTLPIFDRATGWLTLGFLARAAAAACLAVVAYLAGSGWGQGTKTGRPFEVAVAEGASWDQSVTPLAVGVGLPNGARFRIHEGYVELASASGANVAIEGPADVEVIAADHLRMHRGSSWVRASGRGVDFVIDTPSATLVDLGTEFGVQVAPDGLTGAAVFEGVVRAESITALPNAAEMLISEGEAVLLGPWPDAVEEGAAKAEFALPMHRPRSRSGLGDRLNTVLASIKRPPYRFGKNLLVNGGAEASRLVEPRQEALVADFTGWSRTGRVFADPHDRYPVQQRGEQADPKQLGETYFFGGDEPLSSVQQVVDLGFAAGSIDRGETRLTLSALLGGRYNFALSPEGLLQRDRLAVTDGARVRVELLDETGQVLAAHLLGPPTTSDLGDEPLERRESVIVRKRLEAAVPVGARKARVSVLFERRVGALNSGVADDLRFSISNEGPPEA